MDGAEVVVTHLGVTIANRTVQISLTTIGMNTLVFQSKKAIPLHGGAGFSKSTASVCVPGIREERIPACHE